MCYTTLFLFFAGAVNLIIDYRPHWNQGYQVKFTLDFWEGLAVSVVLGLLAAVVPPFAVAIEMVPTKLCQV